MPYTYQTQTIQNLIIGRLQREYILPFHGSARVNQLGGNLPYTASGMALWGGGKAGLLSRVNPDYPMDWLKPFEIMGFDLQGIIKTDEKFDPRFFCRLHPPTQQNQLRKPPPHPFRRTANPPLPPQELLNYAADTRRYCSKTDYMPYTFRVTDIPRPYLEANAAHICPVDYISHKILPSVLKAGMIQTLSMRATDCYMNVTFWEDMRNLIADLSIFMLSEDQALKLFQGRSMDLWDIAHVLASYGPEYIIINTKDGATWVYDREGNQRFIVPAWPIKLADPPTGGLNAFDGGFYTITAKAMILCTPQSAAT